MKIAALRASYRRGTNTYTTNLKWFPQPKRVRNWSPMKEARMLKRVRWPEQRQMHFKAMHQACYTAALNYFGEVSEEEVEICERTMKENHATN